MRLSIVLHSDSMSTVLFRLALSISVWEYITVDVLDVFELNTVYQDISSL